MARRKHELHGAPDGEPCVIEFEGKELAAKIGEPLAVALLANGVDISSRSVKYHRPRGPFCLSGDCGQCWMRVDDIPNRSSCRTPVHAGMTATRQNAFPSADHDILRAADLVFRGGLDHHSLGTTPSRAVNVLIGSTARQLAGMGSLSTKKPEHSPRLERKRTDIAVVGAGPAGLAAASAASAAGCSVVLIEASPRLGGHIDTGLFDDDPELSQFPARTESELDDRGAEIWTSSVALGVYHDQGKRTVLVQRSRARSDEHLAIVEPKALILTTGAYEQMPLFESNDIPGHFGARALARLILRYGVLPGEHVAIYDAGKGRETAERLFSRLSALGIDATLISESADRKSGQSVVAALGSNKLSGIQVRDLSDPSTKSTTVRCDVLASAVVPSPAFELAHQAGCRIDMDTTERAFSVFGDSATRGASVPGVFVAGDLCGAASAAESIQQGTLAGTMAARTAR